MAWLVAASVAITAACGSSNKDDDDDPPASVGTTGTFPSGNTSNGNTSGFNNSGFNNGNTGTTGNMIDQMNDNCVGIEPVAGDDCDEAGLVCDDERGRACTCGGNSDFFPEGIWTCRGVDPGGAGGAGGAGGEGGQNAGGAGGDDG